MCMRRFLLTLTLVAAALAPALSAARATAADLKVGIVDLQRALNESSAGKKAKDQFKGEFEKMQNGLKSEKDSLDRLKDDLDKKSTVLSEDQKKTKMEDFERRRRDLRRKLEDSDAELRKKDQELTGSILKDLAVVIQEIGEREGYTLILENSSSSVLYGSKSIDITDSVIKAFDAKR
ncbi:MAG: OmpH family outer membrane protein [Deltaproteobacteria bacterium]|nr:OmpH family outer membrane protein [Deltaproteobacteria bacterium]